ncbi:MAG: hypothetical protein ABR99_09655 [Rhodobacter sp. BACL10 MAG-121220-bin24]|nr:MAG: hypothetical protein ABR99_09655 [Rhodobacter sp. BACL10 MAG-121220-bin24]
MVSPSKLWTSSGRSSILVLQTDNSMTPSKTVVGIANGSIGGDDFAKAFWFLLSARAHFTLDIISQSEKQKTDCPDKFDD